jgi:hypothetical protein
MRTIQALLVMLCASLFAVGSASAGGLFTPGSSPAGAADEAGYILAKSNGITVTVCGPWNNWCGQANKGNQKCGKWNNWCGQGNNGGQKCGKWNNWCGQGNNGGQKCGKWNNWCGQGKGTQQGDEQSGKKGKKNQVSEQSCTKLGLTYVGGSGNTCYCPGGYVNKGTGLPAASSRSQCVTPQSYNQLKGL